MEGTGRNFPPSLHILLMLRVAISAAYVEKAVSKYIFAKKDESLKKEHAKKISKSKKGTKKVCFGCNNCKNIKNTFPRHIAYDKINLVYFGNEKMYADFGGKYG